MSDYERLGVGYAARRRPDPRIARAITLALGDARTVLNVGAGAGSYEPVDRQVVAAEPSPRMLQQRAPGTAPAVRAVAEAMPFRDRSFAAAMAVLTIHHWSDWRRGLAEMARVAGRVVLLTWDPAHPGFWLVQDHFPDLLAHDQRIFPPIDDLLDQLGGGRSEVVPVPHDCSDGFLGAYWRRPEAYLDDDVRRSISTFARLSAVSERLDRLRVDLTSGHWHGAHGRLLAQHELDVGYRLVVSDASIA